MPSRLAERFSRTCRCRQGRLACVGDRDSGPAARFRWEKRADGEVAKLVLAPDGTTERVIVLRPEDEQRQYWTWWVRLLANLVGCPYCGAAPCTPCRTFTGRIPGRVSEPHHDRLDVAAARAQGATHHGQPAPAVTAQPPDGDPLPYVGFWPYDDEGECTAWLHVWVANLVECPSCGADAGQPCRTHTGRIPGRITTHHQPRMKAVSRIPGLGAFGLDDARELLKAGRARADERAARSGAGTRQHN